MQCVQCSAMQCSAMKCNVCSADQPCGASWRYWRTQLTPAGETCTWTMECTALHCTALHCTAPHCTVLYRTALECTALHCTPLHWNAPHCTALGSAALYCSALHSTVQHCRIMSCPLLYSTALHSSALPCTALHCTVLHGTALHCTAWLCVALHIKKATKYTDIRGPEQSLETRFPMNDIPGTSRQLCLLDLWSYFGPIYRAAIARTGTDRCTAYTPAFLDRQSYKDNPG